MIPNPATATLFAINTGSELLQTGGVGAIEKREIRRTYKPGSVPRNDGAVTIYLAPRFTSGPAVRDDVAAVVLQPTRGRAGRSWSLYLALLQVGFDRRCVTATGRALLPPDFTLTPADQEPAGRYVSVPLSVFRPGLIPSESLGVTQHPARRSPDFPPRMPLPIPGAITQSAGPPWPI